jgi:hypothetical protein
MCSVERNEVALESTEFISITNIDSRCFMYRNEVEEYEITIGRERSDASKEYGGLTRKEIVLE